MDNNRTGRCNSGCTGLASIQTPTPDRAPRIRLENRSKRSGQVPVQSEPYRFFKLALLARCFFRMPLRLKKRPNPKITTAPPRPTKNTMSPYQGVGEEGG